MLTGRTRRTLQAPRLICKRDRSAAAGSAVAFTTKTRFAPSAVFRTGKSGKIHWPCKTIRGAVAETFGLRECWRLLEAKRRGVRRPTTRLPFLQRDCVHKDPQLRSRPSPSARQRSPQATLISPIQSQVAIWSLSPRDIRPLHLPSPSLSHQPVPHLTHPPFRIHSPISHPFCPQLTLLAPPSPLPSPRIPFLRRLCCGPASLLARPPLLVTAMGLKEQPRTVGAEEDGSSAWVEVGGCCVGSLGEEFGST